MPGTSRDLKRRRAPAEDSPSTPSKRARTHIASPSPLAKRSAKRNAAVDDPFNTDASRSPKKRSTSQRVNGTPSKNYSHHTPRKPSGLRTNARLVDIISDELEEEETSGVSDDEKDEPRRSSRLRKPTAEGAKLLLKGKPSARAPHTLPAKKAAKLPFSPSKSGPPPRDVQSSPAPVRRLRGRTPKARNAAQSTPIREKSESKPNAAASDTSRKSRGRPVRRVLSLGNLKNDDLQADETPDATPKPKQGRARKPKDLCSSDDLVDVLVNDQLPKDIEMKDVVTPKNSKRTETLGRATYSSLVDIVLQKLCQRRPVPLTGLEDEYAKVYKLVEATVVAGEGNSMLVIGARGTGKTALVDNVLATLSKSERDNFHTIRLNGFVQTDDKLALREIWRQLGREMEIDEEGGKSYADTLIMLLAILSHPEEISGQTGDQVAKSVIFVLEEFDLFATHARQTLLYNLLDIAQSRKAPIAILGLTTKFDVTESLEKRVKSRFSHRYVHLPLPKSLGSFHDICKAACSIEPSELTFEEKALVAGERKSSKPNSKRDSTNFLDIWNSAVEVISVFHVVLADLDRISSRIHHSTAGTSARHTTSPNPSPASWAA
jgi:origin recognition complex subunit 4